MKLRVVVAILRLKLVLRLAKKQKHLQHLTCLELRQNNEPQLHSLWQPSLTKEVQSLI